MIREFFITAIMACLLPVSAVFGQQLKKENLKGTGSATASGKNYAVFYSAGIPESAIWPLGMKLSKDGATIRHTAAKGNGSNISVNDKVPFRFIIAPADGTAVTWAVAMGINTSANANLSPDGTGAGTGCASYSTTEFPSGWRLPTQREMMIIWLFREGINMIYSTAQLSGQYWNATEDEATRAGYLDFSTTAPQATVETKTTTYKYRCVRDY